MLQRSCEKGVYTAASVVRYNHVIIVSQFVLVPIPPMHHHRVECYLFTVEVATLDLFVHAADIALRKPHLNDCRRRWHDLLLLADLLVLQSHASRVLTE